MGLRSISIVNGVMERVKKPGSLGSMGFNVEHNMSDKVERFLELVHRINALGSEAREHRKKAYEIEKERVALAKEAMVIVGVEFAPKVFADSMPASVYVDQLVKKLRDKDAK